MKRIIILLIFFFATAGIKLQGQDSVMKARHKWGFDLGYGTQANLNVNYFYEVLLLQYQYYFILADKEQWALEFLAQPQFNISRFKLSTESRSITNGYEYGLNGGFLFRGYLLNDAFNPYILISAGPHFVSGVPDGQSPGFIFSDNFFTGLSIRLNENIYLDMRFGFRHISNAGIQNPNGGINNWVGNTGIIMGF